MTIQVGDHIPNVTLMKATSEGPQPVDTESFFAGRKVAIFSVPGAFTPTCSARHLPGFVEKPTSFAPRASTKSLACR